MRFNLPAPLVSARRYLHTVGVAILVSMLIVGVAATLGRATLTLKGAVINKPDIAVLLLMEERGETILDSRMLKESPGVQEYLVETGTGPKWVQIKRGSEKWYISAVEPLRE